MTVKTIEEYLAAPGHCPVCDSDQIEGTAGVEVEGATCTQEVGCLDCDAEWYDQYELTGFLLTNSGRTATEAYHGRKTEGR